MKALIKLCIKGLVSVSLAWLLSSCAYNGYQPEQPLTMDAIQHTLNNAYASQKFEQSPSTPMSIPDFVDEALLDIKPAQLDKASEPRFNLEVNQAPAREFFMSLVADTPYNMVVYPDVSGNITLSLKNVTVREVLSAVQNIYGYEFKETAIGFEILPTSLQTKMFKLQYLALNRVGMSNLSVSTSGLTSTTNSSDTSTDGSSSTSSSTSTTNSSQVSTESTKNLWEEIKTSLESMVGDAQGQSLMVSPHSGIIVVKALPKELRMVEHFLKDVQGTLDKQVIMEAKILEVKLNDGYEQGINWGAVAGSLSIGQSNNAGFFSGTGINSVINAAGSSGVTVNPRVRGEPLADFVGATAGGIFSVALDSSRFNTFIDLLSQQGNVQVLSSPRVSTLNNQKAIIKVGSDDFFVTDASSDVITSGTGNTTTSDFTLTPFFSGIALDVTPYVSDKDFVTLHVHPSITSVSEVEKNLTLNGQASTLPLARSTIRESDSIVRARSGQIIVIGGLMQDESVELNAGLPFLSDIPYLGALFRQTRQTKQKSELVILLKPIVVDQNFYEAEYRHLQDRFDAMNRGFHYSNKHALFGVDGEYQQTP